MSVKVMALIAVQPGGEEAFLSAAHTCVVASRAEPGVEQYDVWREAKGDRRFVFNELYVDDAAVQQHMESEHFEAFGLAIRELVAAAPTIVVSYPVDVW
jgi:quinol monooxygenase YgiN